MPKDDDFKLLDQDAVAEMLQLSAETLRTWRSAKKGPPFRRLGGRVVYEEHDVCEWVASQPKYNIAP